MAKYQFESIIFYIYWLAVSRVSVWRTLIIETERAGPAMGVADLKSTIHGARSPSDGPKLSFALLPSYKKPFNACFFNKSNLRSAPPRERRGTASPIPSDFFFQSVIDLFLFIHALIYVHNNSVIFVYGCWGDLLLIRISILLVNLFFFNLFSSLVRSVLLDKLAVFLFYVSVWIVVFDNSVIWFLFFFLEIVCVGLFFGDQVVLDNLGRLCLFSLVMVRLYCFFFVWLGRNTLFNFVIMLCLFRYFVIICHPFR